MDPFTLAIIFGIAGTGLKMFGDLQAGAENERIAKENAHLSQLAAVDAQARGGQAAQAAQMKGAEVIGAQREALGSSGVDVSSGSAGTLSADTAAKAEYDALIAKNNAAREAWGYRTQADQMLTQGRKARQASYLDAGATLLTGAASVAKGLSGSGGGTKTPANSLTPPAVRGKDWA